MILVPGEKPDERLHRGREADMQALRFKRNEALARGDQETADRLHSILVALERSKAIKPEAQEKAS